MNDEPTLAGAAESLAAGAVTPARTRDFTIDEVLSMARTPEKRARVCLRADLQGEYDEIIAELSTLIDASGKVIADDEAAVGDGGNEARATELLARLEGVRRNMESAMWTPLFRGLDTDELAVFNDEHKPKGENADFTEYNTQLVARCAVDDSITVDRVKALRKKLGPRAMGELVTVANWVCSQGGVDVPKSLPFSPNQRGRQSSSS